MKRIVCLAAAALLSLPAWAEEAVPEHPGDRPHEAAAPEKESVLGFTFSANVKLATDYVWRGISQTDEHPAISGGFDAAHASGFYAGIWGANVDFNDGDEASMEVDLYAGYSHTFANGLLADVGVIHYDYPGADDDLEYDFEEYYLKLGYSVGPVGLSAKYSWSDDFTASTTDDDAHYVEAAATYALPWWDLSLAGHYGHSFGDAFDVAGDALPDNYDDWSVGISKPVMGFNLDLTYTGTDNDGEDRFGELADDRVVFSVSRVF